MDVPIARDASERKVSFVADGDFQQLKSMV